MLGNSNSNFDPKNNIKQLVVNNVSRCLLMRGQHINWRFWLRFLKPECALSS